MASPKTDASGKITTWSGLSGQITISAYTNVSFPSTLMNDSGFDHQSVEFSCINGLGTNLIDFVMNPIGKM